MLAFFGSVATALTFLLSLSSRPQSSEQFIKAENYENLLTWLNSTFETSYISPSICIAPSPQGGFGAFAAEDIKENSILLTIPRNSCVTLSVALDDDDCGKAFQSLMEKAGPGSETVVLAGYLAKEYLLYLEGEDRLFGPYFSTLPWERGCNGQEHVLFWSDEEIESNLKDTMCWADSIDLRGEVKLAAEILNTIVGPSILSARNKEDRPQSLPFLNWVKLPTPAIKDPVPGLREAVTGAFVILLTRAFDDDYKEDNSDAISVPSDTERLIPMLDMFNHNNDPSIRYSTNNEGSVEVRARHDLQKGNEIYNQYREEEEIKMPKHRFFTRFGFIPGIEESISKLLEDKEGIFYAKRREV